MIGRSPLLVGAAPAAPYCRDVPLHGGGWRNRSRGYSANTRRPTRQTTTAWRRENSRWGTREVAALIQICGGASGRRSAHAQCACQQEAPFSAGRISERRAGANPSGAGLTLTATPVDIRDALLPTPSCPGQVTWDAISQWHCLLLSGRPAGVDSGRINMHAWHPLPK